MATTLFLNRPADASGGVLTVAGQPWRVPVAAPTNLELRVPAAGRYAVVTEHGPDEFAIDWGSIVWQNQQSFVAGHEHDAQVTSVGIATPGTVDLERFNTWFGGLIRDRGVDLFRCKGILAIADSDQRFVYHGVHMLTEGKYDRAWKPDEDRTNHVVFIGRNLDRRELEAGFQSCLTES